MKTRLMALTWLSILCPLVMAADPLKIVGPDKIEPYKLVELSLSGDTGTGTAVLWDISPEDLADAREQPGGRFWSARRLQGQVSRPPLH